MVKQFSSKALSSIFNPLIPGFIISGISLGLCSLIKEFVPLYSEKESVFLIYTFFSTVSNSFIILTSTLIGITSSKAFGVEPVLGAILAMIGNSEGINTISSILGFSRFEILKGISILQNGSGGILAIIFGVLLLSFIEKIVNRFIPRSLSQIFTPLLSLFIVIGPYVLFLMPLFGLVSNGICFVIESVLFNDSVVLRILVGFFLAFSFLPLSLMGMNYAFSAIYIMQLEKTQSISLYPILCMAGASQVGAGLSVAIKAKANNDKNLLSLALGGLIPGVLGIGSPLLYGISIQYLRVFLSSCLGAGCGGVYIILSGVSSSAWGTSGLLALPIMTLGRESAIGNMINYLIGLCISLIMGFIFTTIIVKNSYLEERNKMGEANERCIETVL